MPLLLLLPKTLFVLSPFVSPIFARSLLKVFAIRFFRFPSATRIIRWNRSPGDNLNRRNALKLLAFSSAIPAIPAQLLAAFREVHAGLPPVPSLKAFTPHQDATVSAMSELILPATETPGAKTVRVDEFIDHIVAAWFSAEERAHFLTGLDDVDVRTQALFQKNFVDATQIQQAEILRALGDEMSGAANALAKGPRGYRAALPEPEDNFYFMLRQLTLTGYFTSEVGFTQQLHEEIIPGRFDGCVPDASSAPVKGS
jgi:Gluconate 2-dehydrogenase subunit 3